MRGDNPTLLRGRGVPDLKKKPASKWPEPGSIVPVAHLDSSALGRHDIGPPRRLLVHHVLGGAREHTSPVKLSIMESGPYPPPRLGPHPPPGRIQGPKTFRADP